MKPALALGLFLMLGTACGGDAKNIPIAPTSLDDAGKPPERTDAGGYVNPTTDAGADAASPDRLAPVVQITGPAATSNPNDDTVITSTTLKVRCQVARSTASGSSAVDKSSVQIALVPPGENVKAVTPTVNAVSDDEYEALFELKDLDNGKLHFSCSALDLAMPAHKGSTTLDTFLDLGPDIEIKEPALNIYALKSPVPIEFEVHPAPLTDSDQEQGVDTVRLTVAGLEMDVPESKETPGLYQTSVDFDDTTIFKQPPKSAHISVTATNKRTPAAATREAKKDITIDADGPSIKIIRPSDGQIVHGDVKLELALSDPSGIQVSSLVANINSGLHVIKDWDVSPSGFIQTFDTRAPKFGTILTQLTINVTASDSVGNTSTVALTVKLDNLPPIVELDPPLIREWHKVSDNYYCSQLFDPVGYTAVNDLADVDNKRRYRALVEDQTNSPLTGAHDPGNKLYLAGTDQGSVELFIQPDLNVPLLIDTNADGLCDQINDDGLDMAQKPTKVSLAAVTPAGTPYYAHLIKDEITTEDRASCMEPSDDPKQPGGPSPLCISSEMTRVIPGRIDSKPPAVYAFRPSNDPNAGECDGESWELLTIAREGWNCLAARARDTIGNVGISAPLRICFDDPRTSTHPTCSADKSKPPTCANNCTITAAQHFSYEAEPGSWYWP